MGNAVIRPAREDDLAFVVDLMVSALDPYYDGDHQAHAERIFTTHIEGGNDKLGHFSKEQRMFILEEEGNPVALLNLVGKHQGTWKISPLIVAPSAQKSNGFGSQLLSYAEAYAQEHGARQMYCTVAKSNEGALAFFLKKGYVKAGESESHYKPGVTEVMLYKVFLSVQEEDDLDRAQISVVPFEEHHAEAVRALILEYLPCYFNGVNDQWVSALFAGYSRRCSAEVNQKYKLIFVALDSCGTVVGVAGVTPKKGQPIKIMPCVAATPEAFAALIVDLPHHLKPYGRKLYIHIVPSVAQTIAFQRMGWKLEAIMPAAYHESYSTQQWGYHLEEHSMRTMRVKMKFFRLIMAGTKSLEVRVAYSNLQSIVPESQIKLVSGNDQGVIRVVAVRKYADFESMLAQESAEHIVPGMSAPDVLRLLREIYPPHKEVLGVLVLQIQPLRAGR